VKVILSCRPRVRGKTGFERAAGLVESLASRVAPADSLVEINLVGERRMTELNRVYRRRKGAAEILTFFYSTDTGAGIAGEDVLGEIFLCWARLTAGARRRRVTPVYYMLRLLAHGLCHLKGYRHADEKGERKMEEVERKLLRGLVPEGVIARLFE
jgi:rRNA maturation RNase YbeY